MISVNVVLLLLAIHWFADFILQTRWMAMGKSKSWRPLTIHVVIYSLCFLPFGIVYALLNGALHWITDFFSSRLSSDYWSSNRTKAFWTVIGLDQLAHASALIGTYHWLNA
jgi:hypothetical protein